jgi:hypothetical protein
MGFLAGFGDRDIKMVRSGYCYKGTPRMERFYAEIDSPEYEETWCQRLNVYHKPQARIPLPREAFPCAAHHTSRHGKIVSHQQSFHPVGSTTPILIPS